MSEATQVVNVYTDGACKGNPGIGGWGAWLKYGDHARELFGGEAHTTNNRMEMLAVIRALEALNRRCLIKLHTDSKYVQQGITEWIHNWKKRGWKTADKKPVKNQDQWQELDGLAAKHRITWKWLKGHAGHALNERCDRLAGDAMADIRKKFSPAQLRAALADFTAADGRG